MLSTKAYGNVLILDGACTQSGGDFYQQRWTAFYMGQGWGWRDRAVIRLGQQ